MLVVSRIVSEDLVDHLGGTAILSGFVKGMVDASILRWETPEQDGWGAEVLPLLKVELSLPWNANSELEAGFQPKLEA